MKKIALILCVAIMATFALGGCSRSKQEATEKTVITIWSNARNEMDIRAKQVEKFNAEHDDIEVKLEMKGDDIRDLLTVALQGGTAPDIFPAMGEVVYKAGYAREFSDDYVKELQERFVPGAVLTAEDGKYYSVALQLTNYKMV